MEEDQRKRRLRRQLLPNLYRTLCEAPPLCGPAGGMEKDAKDRPLGTQRQQRQQQQPMGVPLAKAVPGEEGGWAWVRGGEQGRGRGRGRGRDRGRVNKLPCLLLGGGRGEDGGLAAAVAVGREQVVRGEGGGGNGGSGDGSCWGCSRWIKRLEAFLSWWSRGRPSFRPLVRTRRRRPVWCRFPPRLCLGSRRTVSLLLLLLLVVVLALSAVLVVAVALVAAARRATAAVAAKEEVAALLEAVAPEAAGAVVAVAVEAATLADACAVPRQQRIEITAALWQRGGKGGGGC